MMQKMTMKAYLIYDPNKFEPGSTVVFAETAGKARALGICTDIFEDYSFTEISVRRVPALDPFYRGLWEMDFDNAGDRVAMVRYANFQCLEEYTEYEDCESCPAKEWCDGYEREKNRQKEYEERLKKLMEDGN